MLLPCPSAPSLEPCVDEGEGKEGEIGGMEEGLEIDDKQSMTVLD